MKEGSEKQTVAEEEVRGRMSLIEHLTELRKRLLISIAAVGVAFLACYHFSADIYTVLMKPMMEVLGEDGPMIFTAPAEAFITYIKVALVAGLFLASPVVIAQIWLFVAPGLFRKEKLYLKTVVFIGTFFFVGGALFGYFGVFPLGFRFFIHNFETENIRAMISVKEYFKFSLNILLAFGITFELPVFIFFLARIGLVTPQWLWKNFRYAVLFIFAGSAFVTPPDIISQVILSVPLTLLYLLATGAAYLVGPGKKAKT